MDTRFGKHALISKDGTGFTSQERLDLGLTEPQHPAALSQPQVKAVTQNRIRSAMSELAHGNIENVHKWLQQVAEGIAVEQADGSTKMVSLPNPARAVELFLSLAEYTLPKLKAVTVDVRSKDGSVKNLSISDLESIVSEQ